MYLEHFGLSKRPFEQLPDPDFLFLSDQHEEALTSIGFAVAIQDSFVVVTGEIGSGKTTLLHTFLREHLKDAEVAFVTQTRLSDVELLQAILVEFGESPFDMGKVELITLLKHVIQRIHNEEKQVVIVVDEAQNLSTEVLEELRLVTCSVPGSRQLVNVVLVGQPQFNRKLDSAALVQLKQRCRLRYHLRVLTEEETMGYIQHRVSVAGGEVYRLFDEETLPLVHRYAKGTPRVINMICDTALIFAFVDRADSVSVDNLEQAVERLELTLSDSDNDLPDIGHSGESISAVLHAIDSETPQTSYHLGAAPSLIGRARDCSIRLPHKTLSLYHATIQYTDGRWSIADLRSTNGTRVNGKRIRAMALTYGDRIVLGTAEFEFRSSSGAEPSEKEEDISTFQQTKVI
ncbi:MAG: AAA family ATPase [Pseudomonadota bacterium]